MTEHFFVEKKRIFQKKELVFDDFDLSNQTTSVELVALGNRDGVNGAVVLFSEDSRAARSVQNLEMENLRFIFVDDAKEKNIRRLSKASGPFWERLGKVLPNINSTSVDGLYQFGVNECKLMLIDTKTPKGSNYAGFGLTLGDNGTYKESMKFTKIQRVSSRYGKGPVEYQLVDEFYNSYQVKDGKFQVNNVLHSKHSSIFVRELLLSKGTGQFLNTRIQVKSCTDERLKSFYDAIERALCDAASKVPAVVMIKDMPKVPGLDKYGMKMSLLHQYAVSWALKKTGSENSLGHILGHNERLLYWAFHCKSMSELALAIGDSVPIPNKRASTKPPSSLSSNDDSGSSNTFVSNFSHTRPDGYFIAKPMNAPELDPSSSFYAEKYQKRDVNDTMPQDMPYEQARRLGRIPYEQPRSQAYNPPNFQPTSTPPFGQFGSLGPIPYEKPYTAPTFQQNVTPPTFQLQNNLVENSQIPQQLGAFDTFYKEDTNPNTAEQAFMTSFNQSFPTVNRNDGFLRSNGLVSKPAVVFQPRNQDATDAYEETFLDADGDTQFEVVG